MNNFLILTKKELNTTMSANTTTTTATSEKIFAIHNTLKSNRIQDKDKTKAGMLFDALVSSDKELCLSLFEKYISEEFCTKMLAKDASVEVDDMELFKKIKKTLSDDEYKELKSMLDSKKIKKKIMTKENLLKGKNVGKINEITKSYYVEIMIGTKVWENKQKKIPESFTLADIKTNGNGLGTWADEPVSPKPRKIPGRSSPGLRNNEKTVPCFRDLLGVCKLGKKCTYLHVDEMKNIKAWYEKIINNDNLWYSLFQNYDDSGWCNGLYKLFQHTKGKKYIFKLKYQGQPEEDMYLEVAYAQTSELIDLSDKKQFDEFYKSLTQYMQHRVAFNSDLI